MPVREPPVARAVPVDPADAEPANDADDPTRSAGAGGERSDSAAAQRNAAPKTAPNDDAPARRKSPAESATRLRERPFRPQTLRSRDPGIRKIPRPLPRLPGSGNAEFLSRRSVSRARTHGRGADSSFQVVVDDFPESELAGPASYGLAEILFNAKDYETARPLFHRAAAKVESSRARAFRSLFRGALPRKSEAQG